MNLKRGNKDIRIVHLPHNVANQPNTLSSFESQAGLASDCFVSDSNYTQYAKNPVCWSYSSPILIRELQKWVFLFKIIFSYDIVHFNFGKKIFGIFAMDPQAKGLRKWLEYSYYLYTHALKNFDLMILKAFGKKIFVTFQGDDARLGEFCKNNFPIHFAHEVGSQYYSDLSDKSKLTLINLFNKYADGIFFLNPDLGWILPKRSIFLPYLHVDHTKWKFQPYKKKEQITFLHAPTHREVKGTKYILKAFSKLKSEGYHFKYELIEQLDFKSAVAKYQKADIVVDQVLAGWYGGFAVEAMALGKPVVSYIRSEDNIFVNPEMVADLPIINAHKNNIYEVLKGILDNQYDLENISYQSRAYVEKWHDPKIISEEIMSNYTR